MPIDYIAKGAIVSPDQRYRYQLWREWRGTHDPENWEWLYADQGVPKPCIFIMLNPSTADGDIDDPTIRKCVGFARRWRFEKIIVLNLFAYRATKPAELLKLKDVDDPVGPHNSHHFRSVIKPDDRVICAWGQHGTHLGQDQTAVGWLDAIGVKKFYALGFDGSGRPRHPLMLPYDSRVWRYNPL